MTYRTRVQDTKMQASVSRRNELSETTELAAEGTNTILILIRETKSANILALMK